MVKNLLDHLYNEILSIKSQQRTKYKMFISPFRRYVVYTERTPFHSIMDSPLTSKQEKLRGKKLVDLNSEELSIWIDACERMEKWVSSNKARRSWAKFRKKAQHELNKRLSGKKKTIYDLLSEENIFYEIENDENIKAL